MTTYTKHGHPDFYAAIAKGQIAGHEGYYIVGRNVNVQSAAPEFLWFNGGTYVFQSVAEQISIVSTDAEDAAAGTGWRKALVKGLDQDYNEIEEIVTLNGLTPVLTANSYLFVRNINASFEGDAVGFPEVGSAGKNVGDITGTGNTSSDVHFKVQAGVGIAQNLFDVIPANKRLFITGATFSSRKTSGGQLPDIRLSIFGKPLGLGEILLSEDVLETQKTTTLSYNFEVPLEVQSKSRYYFLADTSENNTEIEGSIRGFLVEND